MPPPAGAGGASGKTNRLNLQWSCPACLAWARVVISRQGRTKNSAWDLIATVGPVKKVTTECTVREPITRAGKEMELPKLVATSSWLFWMSSRVRPPNRGRSQLYRAPSP